VAAIVGWAVLIVSFKGCTEGSHVTRQAFAATDGYVRAVWVDRNCKGAERFVDHPDQVSASWCGNETKRWSDGNLFLVQHSRRVVRPCSVSQMYDASAASPDCIAYVLVGRKQAGCRSVLSVSGGCKTGREMRYSVEQFNLVVAMRGGHWRVEAIFYGPGASCFPGPLCEAAMRDWKAIVVVCMALS